MMTTAATNPKIADLCTERSYHRNLNVFNLTQNMFTQS